jgi:serine/threonine protein kinase/beta-lactam-binding protein with PASTA domain
MAEDLSAVTGRVYGNRYEIDLHIARGGMAEVYRARDRLLGRPVALKVLFPELSVDRSFVERFRREAQAAANLSHPNIVPVFDWGEDAGAYYIVMEFVDGQPLSAILRSSGPLPPERSVPIATDVASALAYAHRRGVVHRDVKPGNILITEDSTVKVTDFGIARAVNADDSLTQTGAVMGTATYFSPEQAQGIGVDGRSDIYSLGVVMFEMATGRPPFTGESPVAIASKHVRELPPLPHEINPQIPPQLERIIMKAMAKLPEDRYQSASELQEELQAFSQGRAAPASVSPPTTIVEPTSLLQSSDAQPTQMVGATALVGSSGPPTMIAPSAGRIAGGLPPEGENQNLAALAAERREQRRTRVYGGLLGVMIIALAVIVFLIGRSLGYFGNSSSSLIMPNLVSQTEHAALTTLRADGLHAIVTSVSSPTAKGLVIKTIPPANTKLRKGQTVTIVVSAGEPSTKPVTTATVTLPDLLHEPQSQAVTELQSLSLKAKIVDQTTSTHTAGNVIAQHPAAYSTVNVGSTVTLVVAVAPAPSTVAVPNVTGLSPAQAGAALSAKGFKIGTTTYQHSSTIGKNLVIATSPPAGTVEPSGTTVNLVVSSGPSSVTVIDVVGMLKSQAESALSGEGLTPVVSCHITLNPAHVGYVISQSPQGGTVVSAGSPVQIEVGEAPSPTTTTTTTTGPGTSAPTGPGSGTGSSSSSGTSGSSPGSC